MLTSAGFCRSSLDQDLTIELISCVLRWGVIIGLTWIRYSYFVESVGAKGTVLNNDVGVYLPYSQALSS